MLKKILSPKDYKASRGEQRDKPRSQSSGTINVLPNGHRGEPEQLEVTNFGYGEPSALNQIPSRTQSMVKDQSHQPNPPSRNARPSSFGNQHTGGVLQDDSEAQSAVYVAPADTLARLLAPARHVQAETSNPPSLGGAGGGGGGGGDREGMLRSEWKAMQLHEMTMSQKKMLGGGGGGGGSGHTLQTTSSGGAGGGMGPGNDNSEYSVPFNLLPHHGSQQRMPVRAPRIVSQSMPSENSERIISINPPSSTSPQPPSDRSDTISPNSPVSNHSSEPEIAPTTTTEGGNSDYAVPWENSKFLQNMRAYRPRASGVGAGESGHVHTSQEEDQNPPPEKPPQRHRVTPPPPPRGVVVGGVVGNYGNEGSPPPPELPANSRPRNRGASHHGHSEDNTSPVGFPARAQSYSSGKSDGGGELDDARYRSQQHPPPPHPMPGRRLPPPPRTQTNPSSYPPPTADVTPPPPPREREESMWRPVTMDLSIPLDDQPWYHGHVTRAEAEDILRDHSDFSFLVRKSESCQTDYSLSIRDTTPGSVGYYHLRLVYENPGYILGQFSSLFDRVTECISYYTRQRLNIRGAEHKKLRYPVPRSHPMDRSHSFVRTVGV